MKPTFFPYLVEAANQSDVQSEYRHFIESNLLDAQIILLPKTLSPDYDEPLDPEMDCYELPFPVCWFETVDGSVLYDHFDLIPDHHTVGILITGARALSVQLKTQGPNTGEVKVLGLQKGQGIQGEEGYKKFVRSLTEGFITQGFYTQPIEQTVHRYQLRYKPMTRRVNQVVVIGKPPSYIRHGDGRDSREYDHRFWVRGHWRFFKDESRMGHDSQGNSISGRTWVKAYIKGPDDKPLIKRIHVVNKELQ